MLCLAVCATVLLAACGVGGGGGNPSSKTIAFMLHSDDPGVPKELYEGVKAKAGALGYEVELYQAGGNANLQVDQMNEAISKNPLAIVLIAMDGDAIVPSVEKANSKGIPVVATNRDVNGGKVANVVNDEKMGGLLQGEYFAKNLPQGATVVYLTGDVSISCAVDRWLGFKEACLDKRPDIKLLARTAAGDWSYADGIKNMTLWMNMYPKIDGVAAGNDNMAYGARQLLESVGRADGVLFAGVDATDNVLQAITEGKMQLTVKQDADSTSSKIVELIDGYAHGQAVPEGNVLVPLIGITKDNVAKYKK